MTELGMQTFDIPWPPVAKGRPRVTLRAGKAHAYTPSGTRHGEAAIRYYLVSNGAKMYLPKVPLRVRLVFRCQRPISAPRRVVRPATRPDLDQMVKAALDSATGVLWPDDAALVEIVASKVYAEAGSSGSQLLEVEPITDLA